MSTAAVLLLVALASLLAAVLGRYLGIQETTLDLASEADRPILVPIGSESTLDETIIEFEYEWSEAESVVRTPAEGVLTGLEEAPIRLVSGLRPLSIDGTDRVVWVGDIPFYRTLAQGDRGSDVEELQRMLVHFDHFDGDTGGIFGPATRRAVELFNSSLGRSGPTFDPSLVIWLAQDTEITRWNVEVGSRLPSADDYVATFGPSLRSVRLVSGQGNPALGTGEQFEVTADSRSFDVSSDGLALADHEITNLESSLEIPSGTLKRRTPRRVMTVPASAVITDSDGVNCVLVAAASQFEPLMVSIVGGRLGVTSVEPIAELEAAEVVANPRGSLNAGACQ